MRPRISPSGPLERSASSFSYQTTIPDQLVQDMVEYEGGAGMFFQCRVALQPGTIRRVAPYLSPNFAGSLQIGVYSVGGPLLGKTALITNPSAFPDLPLEREVIIPPTSQRVRIGLFITGTCRIAGTNNGIVTHPGWGTFGSVASATHLPDSWHEFSGVPDPRRPFIYLYA